MRDAQTPNATTHSADNPGSHGAAGDLSRGDPDKKEMFNGSTGGGQAGGGAYPNPHTGKESGGKEGFMGSGGQTEMAYHGAGQLGEDETGGGNANAPTAKTGKGDEKDEEDGAQA